ncbi:MAG: MerR family transcriptional regulator [Bacteroidales bacterium]|nr:MerR family transcriptional regulator [Bacteroidales bacterium]MDZ4203554.1 MerR family transcriptional regulator [Bacteroidales bacterium]
MARKKPSVEKMYFSIGEVSKMFDVNTSLIRFWEKEFDIIQPHRNKKGNRLFTKADIENFHQIFHLVKERGYTLAGAKEKLHRNREETNTEFVVVKTLQKIKNFLIEIRQDLSKLERQNL